MESLCAFDSANPHGSCPELPRTQPACQVAACFKRRSLERERQVWKMKGFCLSCMALPISNGLDCNKLALHIDLGHLGTQDSRNKGCKVGEIDPGNLGTFGGKMGKRRFQTTPPFSNIKHRQLLVCSCSILLSASL